MSRRARTLGLCVPLALAIGACGDPEDGLDPVDPGLPSDPGPPSNPDLGPESSPEEWARVALFDDTRIHDVRMAMAPEDFQSIVDDSRGDEWRRATFFIDGVVVADVGVRPAGESSRVPGNPKMGMRVKFDAFRPDVRLGGTDTIKLSGSWNDPFIARDRVAYWYLRQRMPAPRMAPAQLHVNGEPRGAYQIEERWNRDSLRTYFSPPFGPLYRLRGLGVTDPYAHKGTDLAAYVPLPWAPVGDRPSDDHQVVPRMLEVLARDPGSLDQVIDVDTMLDYFAGNALLANTDGFTGGLEVDDHYQYFDPQSGRFFLLPWDTDNTFGSINDPVDRDIFQFYDVSIVTRLVRDTELRELYLTRLETWMSEIPVGAVHAELDRVYEQIRPSVAADHFKEYPNDHFDWSLGFVKEFILDRYASVTSQVAAYRAAAAPRITED